MTVLVTDANDNTPIFDQKIYEFSVAEDATAGELIGIFYNLDSISSTYE